MKKKFIVVVTYGRSGSTLLGRLLNLIENSDIRGENYNALYYAYKSIEAVRDTRALSNTETQSVQHAWYGANDVEPEEYAGRLIDAFQRDVLRCSEEIRVCGFKEIRYFEILSQGREELEKYLSFIDRSFENTYFVMNIRKPEEVVRSSWWARMDPGILLPKFRLFNHWAKYYTGVNDRAILFDYNRVTDSSHMYDEVKKLFTFLEEPVPDIGTVEDLLSKKSLYNINKQD